MQERDETFSSDVTFVVIVSRLCNLRCRYCYEFPDLADRRRMSDDQLARIFQVVAEYYADHAPLAIRFAWQGGEPLLHEPEYFHRALAAQRQAFAGSPHRVVNVLQTNLTRLDEPRIALLRDHFDGVGVSHDVVKGLRLDAGGRARDEQTVENLSRLIAARVKLGGITVLTKRNVNHIRQIYAFWRDRGLPFRLLPVHRGPSPDSDSLALAPHQVVRAFTQCVDLWLADPNAPVEIAPLHGFMLGVLRSHADASLLPAHDKGQRESVFIINTDGSVGSIDDLLELDNAYGNIFEVGLGQLIQSEGHARSAAESRERVGKACRDCPFFRTACTGQPVASSGKEYRDDAQPSCCSARQTLAHIQRRLVEGGIIDAVSGEIRGRSPAVRRGASALALT